MTPRIIASVLTLSFALAGCGKSVVQQVEGLADETCACKDTACVEAVGARMKALKDTSEKPSDADKPALEAALKRMQECSMKIELGG